MNEILRSGEFWTLIADVVVSAILYFGAKYLLPPSFDDVQFVVIGVFQPVTALVLGLFFKQRVERNVKALLGK